MITPNELINKLKSEEYIHVLTLWSAYTDTGEPYSVEVWICSEFYGDRPVAWISVERGFIENTLELIKFEIEEKSHEIQWLGRDETVIDGYEVDIWVMEKHKGKQLFESMQEVEERYYEILHGILKEILKDEKTLIKFIREEVITFNPPKLYATKEEAIEYGTGIKALVGMAKEIEDLGLLPDGEDWTDIMDKIYL